jgi:hypothetical protein
MFGMPWTQHRSHQTRIVYLNASHPVIAHEFPPFIVDGSTVGGQLHHVFELANFLRSSLARKAKAVLVRGARPNIRNSAMF